MAAALLFPSGATGLLYEFCRAKRLANWLGNTGEAHAILVATFMGGLAMGARVRAHGRPLTPTPVTARRPAASWSMTPRE